MNPYLPDEEEGSHRASFATDNDYEGGQWIDGEFYATDTKRGQRQSKEEALYGVFGGGSSDEDERGGGKKGKRGTKRPRDKGSGGGGGGGMAPMSFVSSSSTGSGRDAAMKKKGAAEAAAGRAGLGATAGLGAARAGLGATAGLGTARAGLGAAPSIGEAPAAESETGGLGGLGSKSNSHFKDLMGQSGVDVKGAEPKKKTGPMANQSSGPTKTPGGGQTIGTWEKHTKGFGLKMLEKMGYKKGEGLGKNRDGVTLAPATMVRQQGAGLGMSTEASSLKQNKLFEAQFLKKDIDVVMKELGGGKRKGGKGGANKYKSQDADGMEFLKKAGWRKEEASPSATSKPGKGGKKKRTYKTANEVLASAMTIQERQNLEEGDGFATKVGHTGSSLQSGGMVIHDMRGKQVKLVSGGEGLDDDEDMDDPSTAEGTGDGGENFVGKELFYNVQVLVGSSEMKLMSLQQQLQQEDGGINSLDEDVQKLEITIAEHQEVGDRLERISQIIDKMHDMVTNKPDAVTAKHVFNAFGKLETHFPEEYVFHNLSELALTIAYPLATRDFDNWEPFQDPKALYTFFEPWVSFAKHDGMYSMITDHLLMPKLQRAVLNDWNVQQPAACVELVDALEDLVSQHTLDSILTQHILSKIQRGLESYSTRAEGAVPIFNWIRPWLKHLQHDISLLFPNIRQILSSTLREWNPIGENAVNCLEMLQPWRGVFDETSMDMLFTRCVIPRLKDCLHKVEIDPQNQSLLGIKAVLRWHGFLPDIYLVSLFVAEFFPKWLTVLHKWLSLPTCDFKEVAKWYSGWKSQFNATGLAGHELFQHYFGEALKMMKASMAKAATGGIVPNVGLNCPSYSEVLAMLKQKREAAAKKAGATKSNLAQEGHAAREVERQHKKATKAMSDSMSFKDVVEMFAENNNIEFMPNVKRGRHEGKQVYLFGKKNVYLENGVAFCDMGAGKWEPVALEELLPRAK
jgi:tuftelin-interacting protein 11